MRHVAIDLVGLLLVAAIAARPVQARPGLALETVGTFASPTFVTHAPGDEARLFVVERAGRIRIVENGHVLSTAFLDIATLVSSGGEGGLLGLAFHPDYGDNGLFYVYYTAPPALDGAVLRSTVAAYTVSGADPDVADPLSGDVVLRIDQPASNHNAGWIGFGPNDGYLYIPLGDGGGGQSRAQDVTDQLLGKLLRIDVNGDDFPADPERDYAIPPSNPFVGVTGDDEIFALGLRNPYRASFDRATGDLWIGDVGGGAWEEVNVLPAGSGGGQNFGWGCMEGAACNGSYCTCGDPSLTLPVHAYTHADGCVVTGGAVYRGCAIPELDGTYFFADYCSDRVWSFRYEGGAVVDFTERTADLGPIDSTVAIGEDARGELYFVGLSGAVRRLVPELPGATACAAPGDLDGNGAVGFSDLLILIGAWGDCAGPCPADLDGNGAVGFSDVLILLGLWTV